jgi:hypothetical protein
LAANTSQRQRINSQGFGEQAMAAIAAANGLIPQNTSQRNTDSQIEQSDSDAKSAEKNSKR